MTRENRISRKPGEARGLSRFILRHHVLLFLPLIIAGGRLAVRLVLNLWNMLDG